MINHAPANPLTPSSLAGNGWQGRGPILRLILTTLNPSSNRVDYLGRFTDDKTNKRLGC